jgi:hypothetical protein
MAKYTRLTRRKEEARRKESLTKRMRERTKKGSRPGTSSNAFWLLDPLDPDNTFILAGKAVYGNENMLWEQEKIEMEREWDRVWDDLSFSCPCCGFITFHKKRIFSVHKSTQKYKTTQKNMAKYTRLTRRKEEARRKESLAKRTRERTKKGSRPGTSSNAFWLLGLETYFLSEYDFFDEEDATELKERMWSDDWRTISDYGGNDKCLCNNCCRFSIYDYY